MSDRIFGLVILIVALGYIRGGRGNSDQLLRWIDL